MGTKGKEVGPGGLSARLGGATAEAEAVKCGVGVLGTLWYWAGWKGDRGVARGLIIPHLILPACPQCCRVNPYACWHTHYARRRRCYSNSGWPASASCGGSTPVRPEHPVEILPGPEVWVCVCGGNKVAISRFLLSHCCSTLLSW